MIVFNVLLFVEINVFSERFEYGLKTGPLKAPYALYVVVDY